MRVQHAARARIGEMDAGVDVEGGVDRSACSSRLRPSTSISAQVRGAQPAEMHAVRIEQERAVLVDRQAEMVADAFMHAEAHRGAERRREIAPQHVKVGRRRRSQGRSMSPDICWLRDRYSIGVARAPRNIARTVEEAS